MLVIGVFSQRETVIQIASTAPMWILSLRRRPVKSTENVLTRSHLSATAHAGKMLADIKNKRTAVDVGPTEKCGLLLPLARTGPLPNDLLCLAKRGVCTLRPASGRTTWKNVPFLVGRKLYFLKGTGSAHSSPFLIAPACSDGAFVIAQRLHFSSTGTHCQT